MPEHLVILRIVHTGYGCVLCRHWHDAGSLTIPRDPHYDEHLHRQSKHGVYDWTETRCYDVQGDRAKRVPACTVLRAGEY